MSGSLKTLLVELEAFGKENDAKATQRSEKVLNITPDTGEFLSILIQSTKARRVLELGTSNGYSTLWLADAAKAVDGRVVTVDNSPAKSQMAQQNLERASLLDRVEIKVMDAGELLKQLPSASVDLLFLDAYRPLYVGWWPEIERVLVPGGLLVVDNVVSHPAEVADFIKLVENARWRNVTVPVGKGELMALKPDNVA
jgi:predicted O-methyltransferase YrrM